MEMLKRKHQRGAMAALACDESAANWFLLCQTMSNDQMLLQGGEAEKES